MTIFSAALHIIPTATVTIYKLGHLLLGYWKRGGDNSQLVPYSTNPNEPEDANQFCAKTASDPASSTSSIRVWDQVFDPVWNRWDAADALLTLTRSVIDFKLLRSAFQLRAYELSMGSLLNSLSSLRSQSMLAMNTSKSFFEQRDGHRLLISNSRNWILSSFYFDFVHLVLTAASIYFICQRKRGLFSTNFQSTDTTKDPSKEASIYSYIQPWLVPWNIFVRPSIGYCILSLATSSIWASIFAATSSHEAKGIVKSTMKFLDAL